MVTEQGIQLDPKIVLKGQIGLRLQQGSDSKVSGSMGTQRFKGLKPDSQSLFQGEVQEKLGTPLAASSRRDDQGIDMPLATRYPPSRCRERVADNL